MCKKVLVLVAVLALSSSAWAVFGDPFIGDDGVGWDTSAAVTATSSANWPVVPSYTANYMVDGSDFALTGLPGTRLGYDGQIHSPVGMYLIMEALNPDYFPLKTSPAGIGCLAWVQFDFDQSYFVKDFDLWNGGGNAAAVQAKNVVVSIKNGAGAWSTAWTGALNQYVYSWHTPENNIAIGAAADKVLISVIDARNTENYGYGMRMSEARFYTPEPATMVILGLGGLLLRRKSSK